MGAKREFGFMVRYAPIKKFFGKIQTLEVPKSKVDFDYLKTIGFKDYNNQKLIRILKDLGFLDNEGKPTSTWRAYLNKQKAPAIMARGIRQAYSPFFEMFPEPFNRSEDELKDFVREKTGLDETKAKHVVKTFQELSKLADFSKLTKREQTEGAETTEEPDASPEKKVPIFKTKPWAVNINIQLQIPESKDPELYDALFKALRKHLIIPDE